MYGSFRSLAQDLGVQVHMALGSRQAAPQLSRLPVQKKAPTTPALNLALDPGQSLDPTPTVAHGDAIAGLAPGQGPIVADLTVGPTVESAGAGAIAAHQCPTAAGTLATALIQTQTVVLECLG